MELLELIDTYNYTPEDCAVVTLGTDGLDPGFSSILCVSVLPIVGQPKPTTVYVEGGDMWSSEQYTGINEVTYTQEAVSAPLARKRVKEALKEYPIIIGHNCLGFTKTFLTNFCEDLRYKTYLDTLIMARRMYDSTPGTVKASNSLAAWQTNIKGRIYDKSHSWRLEDLCQFSPGDYYNNPEVAAIRTKSLFIYLLGRPVPTPNSF